jgi:hypothetical protein
MNFPADHIERIKEFGYTESEARFLYIVADRSGIALPACPTGLSN